MWPRWQSSGISHLGSAVLQGPTLIVNQVPPPRREASMCGHFGVVAVRLGPDRALVARAVQAVGVARQGGGRDRWIAGCGQVRNSHFTRERPVDRRRRESLPLRVAQLYCGINGLDLDRTLRTINAIPKHYAV
jgi:hypothetical protein